MPPSEKLVPAQARLPQSTSYCSPALGKLSDRFCHLMIFARCKTTYANCSNDNVIPVLYQISPGKRGELWVAEEPDILFLSLKTKE
jgi:hypothetical protein